MPYPDARAAMLRRLTAPQEPYNKMDIGMTRRILYKEKERHSLYLSIKTLFQF